MASVRRRNEWHQVHGKWSRSLGERGMRIRLFQNRRGGTFYRAVWVRGEGRDVACLHTKDSDEADRLGRQLLAGLLDETRAARSGELRLGQLWELYRAQNPAFLDNKPRTQRDAAARMPFLLGFFGKDLDVRSLTANDQAAYVRARMAGGIRLPDGQVAPPRKVRSVEADLDLFHSMLRWATTARGPRGGPLLDRHPLLGVPRPQEKNPKRPVASVERYELTRKAIRDLGETARSDNERVLWIKMELALFLAKTTGRRLGSIRQLRWDDLDFKRSVACWRAEADKKGYDAEIPMPPGWFEEVRQFRKRLGAVGGWLFPGERKPEQPMDRHLFDKWLTVAERAAQLPKLRGGLWHPYRRAWATARKHLPLKDVAAVGGWHDLETVLTYQQPDRDTMLSVVTSTREVHEPDLLATRETATQTATVC